jgi:hypothetical protein
MSRNLKVLATAGIVVGGAAILVALSALLVSPAFALASGFKQVGDKTPSAISAVASGAIPTAAPLLRATGGPYIGESKATQIAESITSPAALGKAASEQRRTEVRALTYGDIVIWTGANTHTIASAREVYLVVVSAPVSPGIARGFVRPGSSPRADCGWYAVVVDATDGTKLSFYCGPGAWPDRLPPQFAVSQP